MRWLRWLRWLALAAGLVAVWALPRMLYPPVALDILC